LRYLPEEARHGGGVVPCHPDQTPRDEIYQSKSTGFARTNLGVYREPIYHTLNDVALGFVIGYCYAHCSLRGSGL
jgi:hypothetical protein